MQVRKRAFNKNNHFIEFHFSFGNARRRKPETGKAPEGWLPCRIDWFGQVHYPNREYCSGQPSVVLHLSKLNGTPTMANLVADLRLVIARQLVAIAD
jgi:hypothetical protein